MVKYDPKAEAAPGESEHKSVAIEILRRVLVCPPKLGEVRGLLRHSLGNQIDTIATFFEDATVFVLSRMWFDLIFGYFLKLHAITYCGHCEAARLERPPGIRCSRSASPCDRPVGDLRV